MKGDCVLAMSKLTLRLKRITSSISKMLGVDPKINPQVPNPFENLLACVRSLVAVQRALKKYTSSEEVNLEKSGLGGKVDHDQGRATTFVCPKIQTEDKVKSYNRVMHTILEQYGVTRAQLERAR
jgi:hypothetical protein